MSEIQGQEPTPETQTVEGKPEPEQTKGSTWTLDAAVSEIEKLRKEAAKHRTAANAAEKAKAEAEAAALTEQGKYKELYEKAQAEAKATADKLAQVEHDQQRRDAAHAAGIPALWQRLQGETADELAEDAKALAALMQPAQPTPGQPGRQPTQPTPAPQGRNGLTPEEKRARATRTF